MPRAITSFRIRRLLNLLSFLRKHDERGVDVDKPRNLAKSVTVE